MNRRENDIGTGAAGQLDRHLGNMQGTLDQFIKNQESHNADVKASLDKIDERLRDTEKKAAISGAVTGALMSVGVAIASAILGHKVGR